eukprot:TRINITY_DN12223_c0_g1_i1.p1 TRINITY_DN12223_c0_g1~~TRINITY_DN12223_c0_g1_i1.p1  ORF type:complete len:264 (+),score=22.68 TRINITY_DN12223_c0_g1_i1:240-1031(+)
MLRSAPTGDQREPREPDHSPASPYADRIIQNKSCTIPTAPKTAPERSSRGTGCSGLVWKHPYSARPVSRQRKGPGVPVLGVSLSGPVSREGVMLAVRDYVSRSQPPTPTLTSSVPQIPLESPLDDPSSRASSAKHVVHVPSPRIARNESPTPVTAKKQLSARHEPPRVLQRARTASESTRPRIALAANSGSAQLVPFVRRAATAVPSTRVGVTPFTRRVAVETSAFSFPEHASIWHRTKEIEGGHVVRRKQRCGGGFKVVGPL